MILSLPAMRRLIGDTAAAILISAVALSLALTPSLARAGRKIAGRMRARRRTKDERELIQRELAAPVLIVGMRAVGRTLADALGEFEIDYAAIEKDQKTFAEANADGYTVVFGDAADPRIWEPLALHARKIVIITTPDIAVSRELTPIAARAYPRLKRFVAVSGADERDAFAEAGLTAIIDGGAPPGLDIAAAVLRELGIDDSAVRQWAKAEQARTAAAYATAEAAE